MSQRASRGLLRIVAVAVPWLIVFSVSALVIEGALRYQKFGIDGILHPTQYMSPAFTRSPERNCFKPGAVGGVMAPNCTMIHKGVRITTNSAGLHDHEVDEQRTGFHVLVLGDSVTMAAGIPTGSAYHDLLEAKINRDLGSDGFVEFYNYGRGGRSTTAELADLEGALRSGRPADAVLVGVTFSDLVDNVRSAARCTVEPADETGPAAGETRIFEDQAQGLSTASDALGYIEELTGLWLFRWPRELFAHRERAWRADTRDVQAVAAASEEAVETFRTCVRRMRAVADENGLLLAWVIVWYKPDSRAEIMRLELASLGEPVLSLMDVHEEFEDETDLHIFHGDSHPSLAAHRVFARRIHAFLGELGWLSRIHDVHARESSRPSS